MHESHGHAFPLAPWSGHQLNSAARGITGRGFWGENTNHSSFPTLRKIITTYPSTISHARYPSHKTYFVSMIRAIQIRQRRARKQQKRINALLLVGLPHLHRGQHSRVTYVPHNPNEVGLSCISFIFGREESFSSKSKDEIMRRGCIINTNWIDREHTQKCLLSCRL